MREKLEVALSGSKNTKRRDRTPERAMGKVEAALAGRQCPGHCLAAPVAPALPVRATVAFVKRDQREYSWWRWWKKERKDELWHAQVPCRLTRCHHVIKTPESHNSDPD